MTKPASKTGKATASGDASQLEQIQHSMATALMRPLTTRSQMYARSIDGQDMRALASSFILPNSELTSFQRLEIYNQQYWFRLLDCLREDFPGLQCVLGDRDFDQAMTAYIARYPSRSFTLRDLGERLPQFVKDEAQLPKGIGKLAYQMALFEWAQIVAFDAEQKPPLQREQIENSAPQDLVVGLQPYISLLELDYALDDFDIARKRLSRQRTEANSLSKSRAAKRSLPSKSKKLFLAIHRIDNAIYYKRLPKQAFNLLIHLRDGETLEQALTNAVAPGKDADIEDLSNTVSSWFREFMDLQWFCAER